MMGNMNAAYKKMPKNNWSHIFHSESVHLAKNIIIKVPVFFTGTENPYEAEQSDKPFLEIPAL
jgi:hypothetical protein